MSTRLLCTLVLIAAGACTKKQPEPRPTPIDIAIQMADQAEARAQAQGGQLASFTVTFVEPSEDDMVGLIVAAGGWARRTVARSLGVLQRPDEQPLWRRAAAEAAQRYALRPISQSDYTVVCGETSQPRQGVRGTPTCSMKYVDAVLQFNSVRMSRDSGYVTVGVTRVPSGSNRAETVYNCVILAKKEGKWDARRSERVVDIHLCPRR